MKVEKCEAAAIDGHHTEPGAAAVEGHDAKDSVEGPSDGATLVSDSDEDDTFIQTEVELEM